MEHEILEINRRTQEHENAIAMRVTAVNIELVRRYVELTDRLDELGERVSSLDGGLQSSMATTTAMPSKDEDAIAVQEISPSNSGEFVDAESGSLIGQRDLVLRAISLDRVGPRLVRQLRTYRRRGQDLKDLIAPNFFLLRDFGRDQGWDSKGFRLQESSLWHPGKEWIYDLPVNAGTISGIEFAITTLFKAVIRNPVFDWAIWSADSTKLLREGKVVVQTDTALKPIDLPFAPLAVSTGMVRVRLFALPAVELFGIRTLEWRRLSKTRRVDEIRLFCRPIYR